MIYATGISGTIGKFLARSVVGISIDLKATERVFSSLEFERDASLLHLAGLVGIRQCSSNPDLSEQINVEGTRKIATAFRDNGSGCFIYISSGHVYGLGNHARSEIDETTPLTVYARDKLRSEHVCQEVFHDQLERLMIIRIFGVLDWNTAPGSLGHHITEGLKGNRTLKIVNAQDRRDFLAPRSIAQLLLQIHQLGPKHGVFNLCSGQEQTVQMATLRMLDDARVDVDVEFDMSQSDLPHLVGNNSKILTAYPSLDLHWRPSKIWADESF